MQARIPDHQNLISPAISASVSLSVNIKNLNIDVPGISCCPLIPMGGIPRLFMAVAQGFGSDMGMVMELESIVMLQIPSARQTRDTDKSRYHFRDLRVSPMKGPLQQEETLVTT